MPRGEKGFKPGKSGNPKGRPVGAKGKLTLLSEQQRIDLANRVGITPLEHLVSVLRDPKANESLKIAAAQIAAPYMHRKMPIAIEGGDPTKPLMVLDAVQLRKLNSAELVKLKEILTKLGATLG